MDVGWFGIGAGGWVYLLGGRFPPSSTAAWKDGSYSKRSLDLVEQSPSRPMWSETVAQHRRYKHAKPLHPGSARFVVLETNKIMG